MAKITDTHDRIHADLYNKLNACTIAVNELKSEIKTFKKSIRDETDRYVEMLQRAQDKQFRIMGCLFLAVLFCIGIIGYGAIGQQGMYTVRNTLPNGTQQVMDMPYMIPTDNRDLGRMTENNK